MAIIPNDEQFHAVSADVNTRERGSALQQARVASYTMADITSTVILNGGGGGLAGAGTGTATTGFLSRWISATQLGDSDIEKTANYTAPNGGQYELRGNLKIFGESSTSGVAALFVEDSQGAQIEVRDIDAATGAINSEFDITTSNTFISIGTTIASPDVPLHFNRVGQTLITMGSVTNPNTGVDLFSFHPAGSNDTALGDPDGGPNTWRNIHFNPPAYADDAAAGVGGVLSYQVYQTDGTGAAPLNVAGILMVKQ